MGPRMEWIAADEWLGRDRWDPAPWFSVRPSVGVFTLSEVGAEVVEGWRGAAGRDDFPTIRPSDIGCVEFRWAGRLLDPPPRAHGQPIGPGDVVVSKLFPLRAGWTLPSSPRIPADANCVRVGGLESEMGFWVAMVLTHPRFAATRQSAAAGLTLPRLGVRELKELPLPKPPPDLRGLDRRWADAESRRCEALSTLRTLQLEVDSMVTDLAVPDAATTAGRFVPASAAASSWAPAQVALQQRQAELAEARWRPLGDRTWAEPARLRTEAPWRARLLQLGHAHGDLCFDVPDEEDVTAPGFRIWSEPLRADEVLVSLLGTSPKVVFNHPPTKEPILVADHWLRLRPQRNAGTFALVLCSREVRGQLARAASGAARQFLTHRDAAAVRVPLLEEPIAERIHRGVCAALATVAEASAQTAALRREARALVDEALEGRP